MNSILNPFLLFFLALFGGDSEKVDDDLKYLGQTPPSLTPELFAPGVISTKEELEYGSVFNEEATDFFYGARRNGRIDIQYSKLMGNTWSTPEAILPNEKWGYNDPFLSPDEKRLYFISKRSSDGLSEEFDHDIWYVERTEEGWSDPINAGPSINSDGSEYYISFTNDGSMYFASNRESLTNFDIYSSKNVNGEFQPAIPLGNSINSEHYEADVFVDPDESYIIFCAKRSEGLGVGDLYISFKNSDGTWSQAKNMGEPINSGYHELCPFVSKDGKYLFYTSNNDIYWVDAKIIEQFR